MLASSPYRIYCVTSRLQFRLASHYQVRRLIKYLLHFNQPPLQQLHKKSQKCAELV